MTPFWWIVVGWLLAHLCWALVFVAFWWRLVRKLPYEERRTAVREDYEDVRRSILERRGWRN